jgi:predicted metal-dependent hydrolase
MGAFVASPDFVDGVKAFNDRRYFEAHEAWEGHWGHGSAAERGLLLGLIKAAVALYHLEGGNARGFEWESRAADPLLREGSALETGYDITGLADALDSLAAQVRFHGLQSVLRIPREDWPTLRPQHGRSEPTAD